jgi:hypothetical protein
MNAWAKSARISVFTARDLDGFQATEANLRQSLADTPDAELVAFYGHGSPESLVAKNSANIEISLVCIAGSGVTPKELAGRNLYAVACRAGEKLGPAIAKANCRFVGYRKDFYIVPNFEREFGSVVNRSLVAWAVERRTHRQIRQQLRRDWLQLSQELEDDDFQGDPAKQRYRALAVAYALLNGYRVVAY